MAPIPVVCDSCKKLWVTESLFGVEGEGAASVTMKNVAVSPCPYCGGTGHVPDGLYELRSNAAHYFGKLNVDELRALLYVAQDAPLHTLDADLVAARIAHEVPSASAIASQVKNSGMSMSALVTWLTLLAAVLQILIPLVHHDESLSAQQIEKAFVSALEHVRDETTPPKHPAPKPTQAKPGRNDPCSCGSGKKYKHCHGR
jgi:hypothetical protein